MSHEIYIFGSATRGEVSSTSDVDVLVIPRGSEPRENFPAAWSVYSTQTVESYYRTGRLFGWHLHLEAKCIFSHERRNFLDSLGPPAPYTTYRDDVSDLEAILAESLTQIRNGTNSLVYELGLVYTAVRDIAMSASWRMLAAPDFSREAPFRLPLAFPLSKVDYQVAMLARHSSTRGSDVEIDADSAAGAVLAAPLIRWVDEIRRLL
jgi:Nucleotidyltransferase domain